MTQHTDDGLERLLADTFTSRESLADADTAREIAASAMAGRARHRRWPVYVAAAAAVCAVVAGSTFALSGRGSTTTAAPPSTGVRATPTQPTSTTYAENRAAAAAESARVLRLVPLPAGAVRLRGQPSSWPRGASMILGPSDPTLTKTAWWSVPASSATLWRLLLGHRPEGMRSAYGVDGSSEGVHDVRYGERSPQPAAYMGVTLLVQWKQVGGRTLVRACTFTAARAVRNPQSFVTGRVVSVVLRRVGSVARGDTGVALQPVHLTEPADQAAIAELVHAANGLHASFRPLPGPYPSCAYPGDLPPSALVTFHTTNGIVRMHLDMWCMAQVEVWRDGRPLKPTLDPGRLADLLSRLTAAP